MEGPSAGGTNHELTNAACVGDEAAVTKILTEGHPNLAGSAAGVTALCAAAGAGHLEIVKLLVARGSRVDLLPEGEAPVLNIAARGGFAELLEYLLSKNASVQDVDDNGWSALHVACQEGNTGITSLLLEHGASVTCLTRKEGLTPLAIAASCGAEACLRRLLSAGAAPDALDQNKRTPLFWAAKNGHEKAVAVLLDAGANAELPGPNGETPLVAAARGGHASVVALLLTHDAKPQPQALQIAAQSGFVAVLEELLCSGAHTEMRAARGMTPLFVAALSGHADAVQTLLHGGATVDAQNNAGITPLYIAAKHGHTEAIHALCEAGANVSCCSRSLGLTPLHVAAQQGHLEAVNALLARGADPHATDSSHDSPIVTSTARGHAAVVAALLEHGVAVTTCSHTGDSLLYLASKHGKLEVVDLLLSKGASVEDRREYTGETALYVAAQNGHTDVVRCLLDHGAKVEATTISGKTAMGIAAERCHERVVEELLISGARREAAIHILSASGLDPHRRMAKLLVNMDVSEIRKCRCARMEHTDVVGEAQALNNVDKEMAQATPNPEVGSNRTTTSGEPGISDNCGNKTEAAHENRAAGNEAHQQQSTQEAHPQASGMTTEEAAAAPQPAAVEHPKEALEEVQEKQAQRKGGRRGGTKRTESRASCNTSEKASKQYDPEASSGWMNGTWRECNGKPSGTASPGSGTERATSNGKYSPKGQSGRNGVHQSKVQNEVLESKFSTLKNHWEATKMAMEQEVNQ